MKLVRSRFLVRYKNIEGRISPSARVNLTRSYLPEEIPRTQSELVRAETLGTRNLIN